MNHAVIDLGSNSIRLSIYDCINDQVTKVFNRKEFVGLVSYVSNGNLDIEGTQKACEVLNSFKETAVKYVEVSNVHLFATASLRNLSNKDEAIRIITDQTKLVPDVLDGKEEAALGFSGASRFANCDNGVMIDIGGASTELVLFKDYKVVELISLPIGCLNLSLDYVSEIIPNAHEMKRIKAVINDQLSPINWSKNISYPLMVGVGGTIRAALKLSRALFNLSPEENSIDASYIKEINGLLKSRKKNIYYTLYKHTPERLLTFPTGLAILQQAIKTFGCETIFVSKYGLREGYLMDRVLKVNCKSDVND